MGNEVKNENEINSCNILVIASANENSNPFCYCFTEDAYWVFC